MKMSFMLSRCVLVVGLFGLVLFTRQYDGHAQAQSLLQTWYVDTNCITCGSGTLESPFKTILQSLTYAGIGDSVLVAQGVYTEHLYINVPVRIQGGYTTTTPAWTRDIARYQTVIMSDDSGTPGYWNGDRLGSLSVVKDNSTYRMWYAGGNDQDGERIGYADSPDGINWFSPLSMPLLNPGQDGDWDDTEVTDPFVLMTGNGFQMWYVGVDRVGQRAIGSAFSLDGLNWQKNSINPLLRQDAADADRFGFPKVVRSGPNDYKMWYSGERQIWLATSSDGLLWTKNLNIPILAPGPSGAWDDARVYAPYVHVSLIDEVSLYEMWYVGEGTTIPGPNIGYAWSNDGLNWTKSPDNPVLVGEVSTWEEGEVTYPTVIKENSSSYEMWYRGGTNGTQAYGRATSVDGVNWTKYARNPILMRGQSTRWGNSVIVLGTESGEAVLDGLTITGGSAAYGGGIYVVGSSATIRNCTVTGNMAENSGAGIYITTGAPLIVNTVVSSNTTVSGWAGGIYAGHTSSVLSGTVIINNEAQEAGGGMVIRSDSQMTMIASTITNNTARKGGGIFLDNGSSLHIDSSSITANLAEQMAGIRVENSTLLMTNTFIINNAAIAGDAGALSFRSSSGRLVNVTLAGNHASDGVGGIRFVAYEPGQHLDVLNTILAFNGVNDVDCSEESCSIRYSDIQEGILGEGNISVDPKFVDQAAGNYRLRADSPVIDAGTSVGAPFTDFEGDLRPAGGVDMGADEYKPPEYSHFVYLPFVVRQ